MATTDNKEFVPLPKHMEHKCGNCPLFYDEHTEGDGCCRIDRKRTFVDEDCRYEQGTEFTLDGLICVLHTYQKWRRGKTKKMLSPALQGLAIDECIRWMRFINNMNKQNRLKVLPKSAPDTQSAL